MSPLLIHTLVAILGPGIAVAVRVPENEKPIRLTFSDSEVVLPLGDAPPSPRRHPRKPPSRVEEDKKRIRLTFSDSEIVLPYGDAPPSPRRQPRKPPSRGNASALLEDMGSDFPAVPVMPCDDPWQIETEVSRGAQGVIYKVSRGNEVRVAKVPLTTRDIPDLRQEARVMAAFNDSEIMPLFERDPCLVQRRYDESTMGDAHVTPQRYKGSYLTLLMQGTLLDWRNSASDRRLTRCKEMIVEELDYALQAMEVRGFVHDDIKADNILYESLDEQNCPGGLRLADFGLSGQIGEVREKFSRNFYSGSTHLPDCVFEGGQCSLPHVDAGAEQLSEGSIEYYRYSPDIDRCSTKLLMLIYLRLEAKFHGAPESKCGFMGPGRRTEIVLP